jgi:ferritin-like protein
MKGEGIKELAETGRIEDNNHFEALVPRIYELGGHLPHNMNDFHDQAACPLLPYRKTQLMSWELSKYWWQQKDVLSPVTWPSAT